MLLVMVESGEVNQSWKWTTDILLRPYQKDRQ